MHPVVADKKLEIAAVCRRYGVRLLEVFGSAARGGDFRESDSDIDFIVTYHELRKADALRQFFGLREELADLLKRPVDLIEPGAVKNPYVLSGINGARETVYEA